MFVCNSYHELMAVFTLETDKSSETDKSPQCEHDFGRTNRLNLSVNLAVWEDDFSKTTWSSRRTSRQKSLLS